MRRSIRCCLLAATAMLLASTAQASERFPLPRTEGWLVKSYAEIELPKAAGRAAVTVTATANDAARLRWWSIGGPVHRWNEIMLDEIQESFSVLPAAARHLALFHVALDDATAAAAHHKVSEYAAAAAAAAEMLGYLFPGRAALFAAKAEEAMQVRLRAGTDHPDAVEAGRAIGRRVAALAIARGAADRSDAKWSGTVPEGAGKWKGQNPIAPMAGTWQPWVLAHASELRPPAPPAFDSVEIKAALAELKAFARTPKTNHRATFWEVNGGARAHLLWNEIARTKLLESGAASATAARALAALNVAMSDAGIACWEAKYHYWYIRPPQLDPELKTVFPPPNHPSYPAAHGCFSTAAATVLAAVLPLGRDRMLALGKEAAEARVWAGIHYRFDIDAGQEIGRKVAEKALQRAFDRAE
jgi:membrane-associated phospholipid phosphatase